MGTGKRRIELKKIENIHSRRVTFSKRRRGMFKKADELSKLTGCKVASLAFSSSMNPFIYGGLSLIEQAADALAAGIYTKSSSRSNFGDTNYKNDSLMNYEHVIDVKPLQAVRCTAHDGFFNAETEQRQRLATDSGIVKREEVEDPDDKELRKLMKYKESLLYLKERVTQKLMLAALDNHSQGSFDGQSSPS